MTQNRQDTPRKILVTGCASGIGLAQAKCFLKSGDKVYGVDKQTPQAFSHPNFFFFKADLTGDLTDLHAQWRFCRRKDVRSTNFSRCCSRL